MNKKTMTSFERVLASLSHTEPDRVPLFLLLSLYGAKESQVPIKEYFSNPQLVAKTQLDMAKKYSTDCLYSFHYASIELEAFGGETRFVDDGPPNSKEPIIEKLELIRYLNVPEIDRCPSLMNVLKATELMKQKAGDTMPIIGVVMSPFSLPIMQIGFEEYLNIIYFNRKLFDHLMKINIEFCVQWANAQLKAGASAICYFDPLASPIIIERRTYLETGHLIAKEVLNRIQGPVAIHLASGRAVNMVNDICQTGAKVLGFSNSDPLLKIKGISQNKICLLGNLNAIEMVRWESSEIQKNVRNLIEQAAPGGGFILSDAHGEIPWQVPEDTLLEIAEVVKCWGTYPIIG